MSNKKKLIIVISLLSALLLVWLVFLFISYKNSNSLVVKPQDPERVGEAQITLINGEKLYNLTIPSKYTVIKKLISVYIATKKGDPYSRVEIVGEPKVDPKWGYTLLFKIQIPSMNKTLDLKATSSRDGSTVILEIPSEKYTTVGEIAY